MGSDRARVSYDERRQYRAVIMQQGRVTVEADWNEEWQIVNEETRKEVLDIVGPCGTPDDGYRVVAAEQLSSPPQPHDFSVTKGTMYVGGLRAYLPQDVLYSQQSDWIDNSSPIDSSPISTDTPPEREFIYLSLREQEVGAVEDTVLREVALGGPDTAQRLRLVQRITRKGTDARDCETALNEAIKYWASLGYTFVPHDDESHDMRLMPSGTLQVSFQNVVTTPDPCEPQATSGYLGADNQLMRVQISQAANNNYRLLWGYDNASFLYRVTAIDDKTLKLASSPIDDFHKPRQGQAVEVLRSAVKLDADANDTADYMASTTGFVTTLHANYDASTGYVSLDDALLAEFTNATETPVLFLRVWEEELPFTPGTPIPLGDSNSNVVTGMQVTIQVNNGEFLGVGTYWQIAVRPDTPTEVYPHRYLESPQPPNGPSIWVCPLAVIAWDDKGNLNLLADCRNHFDNLVDLSKNKSSGCCDVTIRPEDITASVTLQSILDKYRNQEKITVCLTPGIYTLPRPLQLGPEHSNLALESCHKGVIIMATKGSENQFLDGLIVLNGANNVTFQGLRFALPLVSFFNQDQGKRSLLAGMNAAQLRQIVGAQLQTLQVSIGIRPLNCSALTVKDCYFEFPSTGERSMFGAGIFAGSTCQGVTVQGNQFVGKGETPLLRETPFSFWFGYLFAPTTILNIVEGNVPTTPEAVTTQGASVLLPALQDASFQENLFTGLSVAALIYADAGAVKFERNTVQTCYAGFWLLSLSTSTYAVLLENVSVDSVNIAVGQQLYKWIAETLLDPLIQIGSVIARGYPLPEGFDMSQVIQVAGTASATSATSTTTTTKPAPLIQALFDKAFLSSIAEPASTTEKRQIKLNAQAMALANSLFLSGAGIGRFNTLHLLLATAESEALALKQRAQRGVLHLDLHLLDNAIDAFIPVPSSTATTAAPNALSTTALLIWDWDIQQGSGGTMIMSANKIRNQSSFMSTAFLLQIEYCTVTGNLIFNEEQQEPTARGNYLSLILVPRPADKIPGVAVTGNVFQRTPFLPTRPTLGNVPAPMNTWEFLNTVI